MPTELDLANMALAFVVQDQIRDLDANSPSAVMCKAFWPYAHRAVLGEFDWPFCRIITGLTASAETELRGWGYAYALPADAIIIWRISSSSRLIGSPQIVDKFEIGMSPDPLSDTQLLYTGITPAYVRYSSARCPVSRLPADVFELAAHKLATLIAMPLRKSVQLANYQEQAYTRMLSKLKAKYANLEPEVVDTDFIPETVYAAWGITNETPVWDLPLP